MKIAIGSDHVGYELKGKVIAHLKEKGYRGKGFRNEQHRAYRLPDLR